MTWSKSPSAAVKNARRLVVEDFILANWGDTTYIGSAGAEGRETLRFLLPEEARDVELIYGLMDCCTYTSDHSVINSMAVPPGTKEVGFSYRLAYSSSAYILSRAVDYPTDSLMLYVQDVDGLELTSGQLAAAEPVSAQDGTRFLQFVGEGLTADSDLTATISVPIISVSTPTDYQSAFTWAGVALVTIAFGFCLGYPVLRRRLARSGVTPSEREALLLEIAQLDDEFEEGRLSEEEYRGLRSQKKAQLIAMDQRWRKDEKQS